MAPEREDRLYRFDPADASGVFLGLGFTQCALVGAGLVVSVTAMSGAWCCPSPPCPC